MVYVFITSTFPANKSEELAKLWVDTYSEYRKAQRPLSKVLIKNAVKSRDSGIETTGIHDVKEGKLEEYLLLEQSYMAKFHSIDGFKYKIEVRFKATEALEMIGLKLPE